MEDTKEKSCWEVRTARLGVDWQCKYGHDFFWWLRCVEWNRQREFSSVLWNDSDCSGRSSLQVWAFENKLNGKKREWKTDPEEELPFDGVSAPAQLLIPIHIVAVVIEASLCVGCSLAWDDPRPLAVVHLTTEHDLALRRCTAVRIQLCQGPLLCFGVPICDQNINLKLVQQQEQYSVILCGGCRKSFMLL